jgi:hypothetical protein
LGLPPKQQMQSQFGKNQQPSLGIYLVGQVRMALHIQSNKDRGKVLYVINCLGRYLILGWNVQSKAQLVLEMIWPRLKTSYAT